MSRTLEELDRQVSLLQQEVAQLKQRRDAAVSLRDFEGCFTGDPDWAGIHARIELERNQPDPDTAAP